MFGLLGLLGLLLIGMALDAASSDDSADSTATGETHSSGDGADTHEGTPGDDFLSGHGGEGPDAFLVELGDGTAPPTIVDFNGADDVLVIEFNDPADPPARITYTDDGGSGVTDVSLFGSPAAQLTGNISEIGLTAANIVAVNTAIAP